MPEMTFTVRWPDGTVDHCYSPSLVVHDHLSVGAGYEVAEFVDRTDLALAIASARVQEKFGFACTSAEAQRAAIHARAATCPTGEVVVLGMEPSP